MSACWSTVRLKVGCCAARMPVRTNATRVSVIALTMISFCSRDYTLIGRFSESRDRNFLRAQGTLVGAEVLRRSILRQRDVLDIQILDRLASIVDLDGRDNGTA